MNTEVEIKCWLKNGYTKYLQGFQRGAKNPHLLQPLPLLKYILQKSEEQSASELSSNL